jgi:hypothetical protein
MSMMQEMMSKVCEFFVTYASYLDEKPTEVPMWVIITTVLLLRGVFCFGKSFKQAVKTLEWTNEQLNRYIKWFNEKLNKLFKKIKSIFPPKFVAPEGYRFTGKYILDSKGNKFPEMEKI